VADGTYDAYAVDDAVLLYLVRDGGDTEAFKVLRQRHEQAARRLAGCLVPAELTDDVVAEVFERVLNVTLGGGGPADAFRPYLLTALRRASAGRLRSQDGDVPADPEQVVDPGEPLIDATVAGLETSLILRAFRSLPARWVAVLWHTEIERASPAELTEILGLAPGEAATLRRRARDGLRHAYLKIYRTEGARPGCQPVARQLAAFVEDPGSGPEAAMVAEHLRDCRECDAVGAELADIGSALCAWVAPVFLGTAAVSYLSAQRAAAPSTGMAGDVLMPSAAAARAAGTHAVQAARQQAAAPSRHPSRPALWITAAVVTVVTLVVALTLTLTGGGTEHRQPPAAAGEPVPNVAPAPGGTTAVPPAGQPKQKAAPAGTHSASATPPAPVATAVASQVPGPSAAPAAQLSAAASVGLCFLEPLANEVAWAVTDTGSAGTGELAVSFTLPQGTSLQSSDTDQEECDPAATGTSCQPTAGGASCQLSGISPGSQTEGAIVVSFTTAACGEPVLMTVSGGGASASAQAPGGINCSEEGQ
jgi:DNA-directed RNA polymerase specialized sigma24 family protein